MQSALKDLVTTVEVSNQSPVTDQSPTVSSSSQSNSHSRPYKCNLCKHASNQASTFEIHLRSVGHQNKMQRLQEILMAGAYFLYFSDQIIFWNFVEIGKKLKFWDFFLLKTDIFVITYPPGIRTRCNGCRTYSWRVGGGLRENSFITFYEYWAWVVWDILKEDVIPSCSDVLSDQT